MDDSKEGAVREPTVFDETIVETVTVGATFQSAWGVAMSLPHIAAAKHFAAELRAHEAAAGAETDGFAKARWYASAAILLAFAAAESALDEAQDGLNVPKPISNVLQRAPFWDRVHAVVSHAGGQAIDMGSEPHQSTDLLRAVRNGLAHPKLEWSDARDTYDKLTRRIVSARLPLSPFKPDPAEAFPYGLMSAGVAEWAATTARDFTQDFRVRCGLQPYGGSF